MLETLPLIGLYAEAHYRFRIPFSRYFQRQPELIFDTPWRLEPKQNLTIFLLVKDAHLFPVHLNTVSIDLFQDNKKISSKHWEINQTIQDRQVEFEYSFSDSSLPHGEIEVSPRLSYSVQGKQFKMLVDNYRQLKKPPLRVSIARDGLPKLPGWLIGDTHLHTSLTNDQIEFGASLQQTRQAAELLGLDFLTATDHSYDLDDEPENYLKNDPELVKWKQSRIDIAEFNRSEQPTILPGEEISVANARGSTVHFLHFNDPVYFPGNGDSGEDWPKVASQLCIDDILEQRSSNTVSVGAHTAYQFPWFQRVLLKRGHWESIDHDNPELDGVQILCGTPTSAAFHDSRQLWIDALLRGRKLGVYGGSDGHGNFNRNWHIRMPMWSMGTHEDQIFAQSRTLVKSASRKNLDIVNAMKERRTALSTGPMGDLTTLLGSVSYGIGDTIQATRGDILKILASGVCSDEFGSEMDVSLYAGNTETEEEVLLFHEFGLKTSFELDQEFAMVHSGYLRLEISSEGSRWPGIYISSPIWIELNH